MKESRRIQLSVLRRLEKNPDSVMVFEHFFRHPLGHEESSAPKWSDEEVYNIQLMLERGELTQTVSNGDEPWFDGTPGEPYRETYIRPSAKGHESLRTKGLFGWFRRQLAGTASNVITILISVAIALCSVWAIEFFGP